MIRDSCGLIRRCNGHAPWCPLLTLGFTPLNGISLLLNFVAPIYTQKLIPLLSMKEPLDKWLNERLEKELENDQIKN
jgi:hypothetical protein